MTGRFRSSAIFYNSFRRMSVSSSITSEPVKLLSCICFFAIPWAIAYLAPPSMEFSRQEYWSVFPFPSPGDLLNPGIKPRSPALQVDALLSESSGGICLWNHLVLHFLLRSGTRWKCPIRPLLFNIVLEILATSIREEKEMNGIQIGKKKLNCHCLQMTWYYTWKILKTLPEHY